MEAKSFAVPPTRCVGCGHRLDRAGPVDHSQEPKPGDLTGCMHCGAAMVFTETMGLRALTDDEWDALPHENRLELSMIRAFAKQVYQPSRN